MSWMDRTGTLAIGMAVGMLLAAYAQNRLDDRAVASGYLIHKSRAYQLAPAPRPHHPEREG